MDNYLGRVEIRTEVTDLLIALKKELEHYKEGILWFKNQEGIRIEINDEIKETFRQMQADYDVEMQEILRTVQLPYPTAKQFKIGEGFVDVWGE